MRQRNRTTSDPDAYGSLFDPAEHDDAFFEDPRPASSRPSPAPRPTRSDRHHRAQRRSRGRIVGFAAGFVVVLLALAVWLVVLPLVNHFSSSSSDYSGSGSGTVRITVQANDGAGDIADTLHQAGVIASDKAFTRAAEADPASRNIQPGTYLLHRRMSGKAALRLILSPSAREDDNVVVPEGATSLDIARRLAATPCIGGNPSGRLCGPGFAPATIKLALANVSALGLPTDFAGAGRRPTSVEGFLYPATYFFPETSSPTAALNQMIVRFADQVRTSDFTARAKVNKLTPYQQLTLASIAQSEARFPGDMAKVTRALLNRLAVQMPLQSDATSAYGAKLKGLDLSKVIYYKLDSPYNSYLHKGLPPTPISNPGADALNAAAHPAAGNWIYFVTDDKAGHLYFTNSATDFNNEVAKCMKQHVC